METMKDWEELLELLPKVRNGWVAEVHEHLMKGCRCGSCYEFPGWEMGNDYHTTYCDETKGGDPDCLQQLLSWEEAKTIELLLKHRGDLARIIDWYIKEEARITYNR